MKKVSISLALVMTLSLALVSAFGVSAPYWMGNPMTGYPGMRQDVNLNLQNIASPTGSIIAVMEVVEGADVASLSRSEYEVKEGATLDVPLEIDIPEEASIGSKYFVKVNVRTKTGGEGGTVALATGMVIGFDVLVEEKPAGEAPSNVAWYLVIAIVVIAIVIISVSLSRRNRRH